MTRSPILVLKQVLSYNYSARLQSKVKDEEESENYTKIRRKRKADEVGSCKTFLSALAAMNAISLFIHSGV
jgi:hypothetical protein